MKKNASLLLSFFVIWLGWIAGPHLAAEENGFKRDVINVLEKLTPEIEVDRKTFIEIAEKKTGTSKKDIDHLKAAAKKEVTSQDNQTEWMETVRDIDEKFSDLERKYHALKNTGDENWPSAKNDFNNSFQSLEDRLKNAIVNTLPEKEAYEWKARHKIDEADYKIAKINSRLKDKASDENEKTALRKDRDETELKRDQLKTHLKEIKAERPGTWKSLKQETDELIDALD